MLWRVVCGLLSLFPAALAAQQGTITYTYSAKYDFEIPERWADQIPTARSSTVLLHFGPSASLMTRAPEVEEAQAVAPISDRAIPSARVAGMAARMRRGSAARSDQEDIRDAYVRYDEGTIVETRDFMGRTFRIAGQRPAYEWRLTSEQAEHRGYMVIKATAQQDSTAVEAWFTPEIPVQGGPASFGGLPGMILVLSVDDGRVQYFATEIDLEGVAEDLIRPPEDGDEVTREEYEEIVAEKLEELAKLRGRDGRDRGPGGDG